MTLPLDHHQIHISPPPAVPEESKDKENRGREQERGKEKRENKRVRKEETAQDILKWFIVT